MPIHEFFQSYDHKDERFISIDDLPDHRTDVEKEFTQLAVYNHAKSDYALAERLAEESINVGGAWVTLFIKEPFIDKDDFNTPWDEDANPIYRQGINIKAWFKVDSLNQELTRYGIDSPLQITVVFSRAVLSKAVGLERLVNPGDVIEAPYNSPKLHGPARFRVLNAYDSGNWHYRWLYYTAVCELLINDASLNVPHQDHSKIK